MGNILSAIHDDMDEYEKLCKKYGENPQYSPDAYGHMLLDCYSEHARKLKERQLKEWQLKEWQQKK